MKKFNVIVLLLTLVIIIQATPVIAYSNAIIVRDNVTESMENKSDVKNTGSCGPNLTWEFDSVTGTLSINGSGVMDNFSPAKPASWSIFKDNIKTCIIHEGVTTIGRYAFYDYNYLINVSIPGSVNIIKESAFAYCSDSLASVIIQNGLTVI